MPPPAQMRLRITRQLHESIDGIHFPSFRPGYVYEVGTTVGNYLLAVFAAEPASEDQPYLILPPERQLFCPAPTRRAMRSLRDRHAPVVPALATAADREPRRPRNLRRRIGVGVRAVRASEFQARVVALAKQVARIKRELDQLRHAG